MTYLALIPFTFSDQPDCFALPITADSTEAAWSAVRQFIDSKHFAHCIIEPDANLGSYDDLSGLSADDLYSELGIEIGFIWVRELQELLAYRPPAVPPVRPCVGSWWGSR